MPFNPGDPDVTGLRLRILRSKYDGSNDGVSSRCDQVTLVGYIDKRDERSSEQVLPLPHHVAGPFTATEDAPAVVAVYRNAMGRDTVHVQPLVGRPGKSHFMAGGTYLTGDSRFSDVAGFYGAVSFHDRQE